MKKLYFIACAVALAAALSSCGNKKSPRAEVTPGGVFANEVPTDTTEAQSLEGQAYTIQIPAHWKSDQDMMGNTSVLHFTNPPYTKATITTLAKLSLEEYIARCQKEGSKQRPDKDFYGRKFVVFDTVDKDGNLIISAATPLGEDVFTLTLVAGPQRLPMESTHSAMFDNMKTLLENVIFN